MTHLRKFTYVLAVLGLVWFGTVSAQDDAGDPSSDDTVVLRAGGAEETLADFDTRFEIAMRGLAAQQGVELTPEVRAELAGLAPQFLEQRAREVALVQAARERGLEVTDEEVDARVEEIRAGAADDAAFQNLLESSGIGSEEMLRTLLREDALVGELQTTIEGEVSVDEADVQAAYDARTDEFTVGERVCASHILVETEAEAEEALAEIEAGATFADVAAERGTDATRESGGELGCFERGQMVSAFEEAVFDPEAQIGEPFGPIETQFGQHLILVTERQEARTLPFDEVREELAAQLREEAVQDELVAVIEAGGIETFPERLPAPVAGEATDAPAGEDDSAGDDAEPAPEGGVDDDGEESGDETSEGEAAD